MDDTAALRTTIRRCTALLIALLASAFRPLSDYQYDGTVFLAGAVIYLVVSALGRFPGEDPILEVSPADPEREGPTDPAETDRESAETDRDS
ncbi:hypothetical protein [Halosimplex pelagicum]|uniref:Uncharacterized protein n=1 Tax=Halosimplex pelagicum TaxID=869886 RepID=A0A7D5T8M9_9EURY|nr:hypothetical protein [Halosimplex pelagicum]QLH81110.1 hypothetical protein HZS54_05415 [Halosimplex pelagicum]